MSRPARTAEARLDRIYMAFTGRQAILISVAATTLLTIVLNRIDTMMAGPDGMGVAYLQLSFSREYFETVIASWGPGRVDIFLRTIWIDFLYPPAYAFLLSSAPAFFTAKKSGFSAESIVTADRIFLVLPFAAALFDYTENILHIIILKKHLFNSWIIFAASSAASIKWLLIIVCLGFFLKRYFEVRKEYRG